MNDVYIIGVGMTRFGKYPDRHLRALASEAMDAALADAGLEKKDLEAVFFSNSYWGIFSGQHSIRGQVLLRPLGIEKIPIANVENACAGASTALHLAAAAVAAGNCEAALALGAEKLFSEDKEASFRAFMSSMDVENITAHMEFFMNLSKSLSVQPPPDASQPGSGKSIFMDAYAMAARWHMSKYGSTQRQLAVISAKNHFHSSLNPLAQIRKEMTVEEVLADKLIAYPLTRPMCAPLGDGASAAIVCSAGYLKKLIRPRPVRIRVSVLGSGMNREMDGEDIGLRLSRLAYEKAGIGPDEIDIAEVHDATAYGELHQSEVLGFCPEGEGGRFAETGATRLGGRLPINTSGGLESRGHPIGASGLAQIHELVLQLRGEAGPRQAEGVRLGLTENGGGNLGVEEAAMCIHILEKV